jgi:glycosyltransferase involved in cell wall biosynthesis
MGEPLISVLFPVYNGEKYLAQAVDSILAQTLADFELIIIDDGSTDGSLARLKLYERDPRVRLISRPNTGITGALNEMIGLSRGRYLARMDSDDAAAPERFAKQVEYLNAHPECVIVGSRVMIMDPYGSPVSPTGQKLTHEEIDAELLTSGGGWAMVHPSVMMRKEAVARVGGYRSQWRHCEDHDLYLRLAEVGKVANLPEPLLWYRRHYGSINFNKASEQAAQKEALLREAYERRGLPMPNNWKQESWAPPPAEEQARLWGWAALKIGNLMVARRHAFNALVKAPQSVQSWRLLYCAIRGR